jgi:hypothetical protein
VCAVRSQDGDDEESKPENGVDNAEDHVRLRTGPALEPLYMSRDNFVSQEDASLETLKIRRFRSALSCISLSPASITPQKKYGHTHHGNTPGV